MRDEGDLQQLRDEHATYDQIRMSSGEANASTGPAACDVSYFPDTAEPDARIDLERGRPRPRDGDGSEVAAAPG